MKAKNDIFAARAQRGSTPDSGRVAAVKREMRLDEARASTSAVEAFHAAAPIDDEPDDDPADLAEARLQAARGDTVSLADLVAEAEAGYDVDALKARRGQRDVPAPNDDLPAS